MLNEARVRCARLAKAAGVSLATVDRVLNARPGVRKQTVKAVNEAIERIGFIRNQSAANLARGRQYRFQFLLPETGDDFLNTVIERIEEASAAFRSESLDVSMRQVLSNDPHVTAKILSRISPKRVDGVAIMAPESPQVRDATTRLMERGVQVVQFISGQPGLRPLDFIGVDNYAAGATAGRLLGRFLGPCSGKILIVAETMNSLDSVERRLGFDTVLTADFRAVIANSCANHPDIVGAYLLSSEARPALKALCETLDTARRVILAHERTAYTEARLRGGTLDAVIAQNPGHLVRSAIRLLRARSDDREPFASQEKIRLEILIKENLGQY